MKGLRGTPSIRSVVPRFVAPSAPWSRSTSTWSSEASAVLPSDPDKAVELVGLIDQVRGYEGVKLANVERYRTALAAARQRRELLGW